MIHKAKHLYYRGSLSSCNYACNYCPFAKKTHTQQDLCKDRKALERFYTYVNDTYFEETFTLFITPYGEAMIHEYYMDAIIAFAQLEKINRIGIQTNLSFDIEKFLQKAEESGARKDKIKFWATYHPTMVSKGDFAQRIQRLATQFEVCVGMVAIREEFRVIEEVKKLLPEHVYFWLNAQAKHKGQYSKDEIDALRKMDPCFENEFPVHRPDGRRLGLERNAPTEDNGSMMGSILKKDNASMKDITSMTDNSLCSAGTTSFLIEANGDVRACHENKTVLFHIYRNEDKQHGSEFRCQHRSCDCYLAYSNSGDTKMKHFFGEQLPIRIPQKHAFRAIFLDIDGTMTEPDGRLRNSVIKPLEWLSQNAKLYFVTALPYEKALKKCHKIWSLFSGGVFSNGAYVVEFDLNRSVQYGIEADSILMEADSLVDAARYISIDRSSENVALRLVLPRALAAKLRLPSQLRVTYEGQKAYVQQVGASKVNGIVQLQQWCGYHADTLLVVGNGVNDLDMVQSFLHSVATLNAPVELRKAARYVMEVEHLPYIID